MRYLVISDIHGASQALEQALSWKETLGAEKILLLGDVLYHGPRNDLPVPYAPKEVAERLNGLKEQIVSVQGNCDAEVDQMVLQFPILADYIILYLEGRMVFATHGHVHNEEHLPPLKKGDILLHGHTHVQAMEEHEDHLYLNPGSVSIPKNGNENSYMVYENGVFTIKNMEGAEIRSLSIKA